MRIALLILAGFAGCTVENIPGKLQDHKCLEFGGKGQCICHWQDIVGGTGANGTIRHYEEMSCQAARIAGFRIEQVKGEF